MSARRILSAFLFVAVAVFAAACSSSGEIPEATSVKSLGKALDATGLRVNGPNENDFLSASYFTIPGVQFEVNGEMVLAYEFGDEAELAAQRSLVSPDGWGIGSKYIQWTVAPNYYQNGSLIVIYDGDVPVLRETLATAMGERFAGSDPT